MTRQVAIKFIVEEAVNEVVVKQDNMTANETATVQGDYHLQETVNKEVIRLYLTTQQLEKAVSEATIKQDNNMTPRKGS